MRIEDFELMSTRYLNGDYFILDLLGKQELPEILPGQFVQMRVDNEKKVFLRRPISVFDVDYNKNILSLLIKKVGAGTEAMARLKKNETVNLIFPLGNSFSIGPETEKSLLVGGGVGVAPLLLLARLLKEGPHNFKFLFGYQTVSDIIEKERFAALGEVLITTDDGSYGYKGLVTEHPELSEGNYDRIYTCGPEPMMKAVAAIARSRDKFCEVSLENTMACGYGVCLCCVVNTSRGNVCTCTEGPVFNINELKWQI
ncbi:MAG: dihydroorotate dehydrogenase electron transfer subunit [Bacteroidales bacterium]|jgi:dihydroorotate dehydrogenase electron transfer subunit|nr:dihydroorotate dehydrogenase electron transfer subunit [Bacteroidales bacterium]